MAQETAPSRFLQKSLISTFIPDGAGSDYWSYCRWRAAHRVFSAIMGTMSTQAMLTAIGVGSSRAIPAAAALNWVLKDGLGKIGKLAVTATFGRSFDSDLKKFRFSASVIMVTTRAWRPPHLPPPWTTVPASHLLG